MIAQRPFNGPLDNPMPADRTISVPLRVSSRRNSWGGSRVRGGLARIFGGRRKSWFWGAVFDIADGTYRTSGLQFEIPGNLTTRPFRARFFWDFYEPQERYLVDRYIQEHDRVLELGGCLGVVACTINRKLADPRQHVVVEANPGLIAPLRHNRELNASGFQIEHGIISRSSNGVFFIHEDILEGSVNRHGFSKAAEIKVPVKTVDEIESKNNLTFNSIILDIEGAELAFLKENPGLLSRVDLIIVEFHPAIIGGDACEDGRTILRDSGFLNVETIANTETWVRKLRAMSCASQGMEMPTTTEQLPAIASVENSHLEWDGVDGLYVRSRTDTAAPPGLKPLQLVAAPVAGRHRMGIRFRLPPGGGTYRVTALVKCESVQRVYLESRDGASKNFGLSSYDLKQRSVLRIDDAIRDAGIETTEFGWIKIWNDLDYIDEVGVVYIGHLSGKNELSYLGDGGSALQFLTIEIGQPRISG